MDKVGIICDRDRFMLREFSRRSLERLTGGALHSLHVPLPLIGTYIEANVRKEVDKDRIIIEAAGAAHESHGESRHVDVDAVFEATKAVDREFVGRLVIPAFSIKVRYEDIAETRKQRIVHLSTVVLDLLERWKGNEPFEEVLRSGFAPERFADAVTGILHLYNQETRLLGRSIRFLHPFNPAVAFFADSLFAVMESVSKSLTEEWCDRIYGRKPVHVQA